MDAVTNDMSEEIAATGFNDGVVPAHVQRMLTERAELKDKFDKLGIFFNTDFFGTLDEEDQQLLHDQYGHMSAYLAVLNSRIARATA